MTSLMPKQLILCIAATLLLAVSGCSSYPARTANFMQSAQEKVNTAVEHTRTALEAKIGKAIPTLNVFVQTPEGSWFASSAGKGYKPITADTYYRFASVTKNFTSTAVLNMYEDGWLNINDKITAAIPGGNIPYVPATAAWDIPNKDQITIRMLLQHSAGVYDVDNDPQGLFTKKLGESYTGYALALDANHQFTAEEMVKQNALNRFYFFLPGTGYHYSNTGYAILGEIVGRIYSFRTGARKHLTDYLRDYLYGPGSPVPLGMHFPYLASDRNLPSPYSCGHILINSKDVQEICNFNMSAQVAEGNGYSTMKNLNTYIRTLMKGQNVLTPASVEMMKTDVSAANPAYGLGCFYRKHLGYGHNGARIGNMSLMIYDPEYDVSLISYISAIDANDFVPTFKAIEDVAYAVRDALGYPAKP